MPPEHFDWSDGQPPQAGPALIVRTRRSDHTLHGGTTYSIGRDPNSDIVVLDSRVSWRHGLVRVEGNGWLLEDVGSTNGTFVGLQRVDRVPIAHDSVVRLGNPEDGPILRFMLETPAAQPGPGLPPAPQFQAPGAAAVPPAPQPPQAAAAMPFGTPPPQAPPQPQRQPQPQPDAYARPPAQPVQPQPQPQPQFMPPVQAQPQPQPPQGAYGRPPVPPQPQPPQDAFARPPVQPQPQPDAGGPSLWPGKAADPPSMSHPAPWWAASPLAQPASPFQAAAPPAAPPRAPAAPPRQPPPQPVPREPSWEEAVQWREPVRQAPPARAAVAGAIAEPLPSVDRRPTSVMPLPAKPALRIGRVPDNDIVLPDLDVSRHHAELRKSPAGSYEIVDLGSHNGTYVNGRKVSSAVIGENDIVSIGHSTFRLVGDELRVYEDEGEITFKAQDLVVRVAGGKILLNHVSFPVPEKALLGVIGPSGAGKSTLLGALTGMRPADEGTVLYDNRDLYANYAELRYRIGLVPQESVLHTQLTARRALQYSAELRFPADTTASERTARVDEVMAELGLTRHANTRADRLSGGQLKRVNVAQELLTKPSLLFLDEPTSGLDPGLDKSVMEQMRDLAHDGRTIVVVTHSVANLDTCDRLLVLFPGGKVAYYGPPGEGLKHFGLPGWAEVFQAFEKYPDRDWAGEFAASPMYQQYVAERQRPRPPHRPPGPDESIAPLEQHRGALQQLGTLTRRYVRVIASDRGYLIFMALLPIILGGLIFFVDTGGLRGLTGTQGSAYTGPALTPPQAAARFTAFQMQTNAVVVLLMLVICACLTGAALSVRELVKERAIFVRERAAGLSSGAYLSSKLLVLGVISVVQAFVLVLLGVAIHPLPFFGSFVKAMPLVELLIGIAVLCFTSMCLGLLVSALVSTSEKAMPLLVLLTMVQVILSGGVPAPLYPWWLTAIAPARWGFGAVASTADLKNVQPVQYHGGDKLWDHTAMQWLTDVGVMIGLGLLFVLLTWYFISRLGPHRRKA